MKLDNKKYSKQTLTVMDTIRSCVQNVNDKTSALFTKLDDVFVYLENINSIVSVLLKNKRLNNINKSALIFIREMSKSINERVQTK